jgi:hypothetical protein
MEKQAKKSEYTEQWWREEVARLTAQKEQVKREKRTLDDRVRGFDRRLEQARVNGAVWKEEWYQAMANVKAAQLSEASARQTRNELQR